MITAYNERVFEFRGLQADLENRNFPVEYSLIANGSTFHAMDEDQLYIYNKATDTWEEYSGSGGGGVKVNKQGEVTGLAKTLKVGNKIYSIAGTTQTGMIEYFYDPKKASEPYLSTTIGAYTTIKQTSIVPASMFDLFEQIFDKHGTIAYVTSVDDSNKTVTVRTMTTGASINDDIIVTKDVGGISSGTNLKGMSPADLIVAMTAPTAVNNVTTNAGGNTQSATHLNAGEKLTISTVTPSYDIGGQGNITSVYVRAVTSSGAKVLYESPEGTTYTSGTPITLTTPYTTNGRDDVNIEITMTTSGTSSVNPSVKKEAISFVYDGKLYYSVNSNDTTIPGVDKWAAIPGEEFEITVIEDQVVWFMLPDQTRKLQQFAMSNWSDADWYFVKAKKVNDLTFYCYNTGALYADTYRFRLISK